MHTLQANFPLSTATTRAIQGPWKRVDPVDILVELYPQAVHPEKIQPSPDRAAHEAFNARDRKPINQQELEIINGMRSVKKML